jgi:3-dehydroquinate dehydratase/shikimate dehydrogenase
MIAKIKQAEPLADVIEVRFDSLLESEFVRAIESLLGTHFEKPLMATLRPNEHADLTPARRLWRKRDKAKKELHRVESEKRFRRWFDILDIDAIRYVDFEYDIRAMLEWCIGFVDFWGTGYEARPQRELAAKLKGRHLVLSEHYFLREEIDLNETYQRIVPRGDYSDPVADGFVEEIKYVEPEIIKIAAICDDSVDALTMWKLLNRANSEGHKIIPIAMGDGGKWTRILGLAQGAYLTYASLESGGETAPGQVTASDLIDVYRVKELDKDTKVFGVIGDPISQSMSPYMHNPAFVELGLNAVFIPFLVKNICEFITRMVKPATREVELNFGGFSVTMPHKQSIIPCLDAIDEVARAIGAVNTVHIDAEGKLTGYNTDAHGFITPLKAEFGDVRDARVAVFGAGGAARAVVYALKQEGADVTVFARDAAKGKAFADEFGVRSSTIADLRSEISNLGSNFDILVDTTPLGMKGPNENDSLFNADELKGLKFVYDLVTKMTDTPLIAEAKKAGIPAIGGLDMLIAQGAKQLEIWTGRPGPESLMREKLLARMAK